ncbi:MFS transporter [Celeribacter sp.]|uniref:MFS transporter n=1 Tax=Celeribacter sp. TaxID=1890673 RepID=UPI003A8DABE2
MVKGFLWLTLAYGLSQFYRACLAVFAPVLAQDIAVSADQISTALGLWFLAFAAMQIPVGWLLDTKSPRITAAALLVLGGGGGALVFSVAQGPLGVYIAMIGIGIGCSSVLMSALYIFARLAPPERFGTLAGLILGIGSLGNVAASVPLSFALDMIGWRATMVVLAGITAVVGVALWRFVEDPPRILRDSSVPTTSFADLLRIWPIYPVLAIALVAYAPGAGLRGSWIGGYLTETHGLDTVGIGRATIFMALAMIAGNLAFGPVDRIIRSRRLIVGGAAVITGLALIVLWLAADTLSLVPALALFMIVGFFTSSYPQIMNHGRSLLPEALIGRGVTLINLASIGGVGLFQIATARTFNAAQAGKQTPADPYGAVFLLFAVAVGVGLMIYLTVRPKEAK